jgi:hypothetical protein
MTEEVKSILADRRKTHGDYAEKSEIAQALKTLMRSAPNWSRMSAVQREGLEHVVDKLTRALVGEPDFRDHYVDAIGYLTRILEDLDKRGG